MTQAIYILLAVVSGGGIAMQASMLGAMGVVRTPSGAVWVSLLATVIGLALVIAIRTIAGSAGLPSPFDGPYIMLAVAGVATIGLVMSVRGIDSYFALTGLLPIPFLVGAGFLAPRLGVGLFISAIIAGQLITAVFLDQIGAFGSQVVKVDAVRVAGVVALMVGVVLIRGLR
jgi:transporter family-2 protein